MCVTTCLITVPWTNALGRGLEELTQPPSPGIRDAIRSVSFDAPPQTRHALELRSRQSVASTTEPKLLLGVVTGALIVGGMTMMAYGSTATCKGKEGASTGACDRTALIGTMSFAGGTAMLLLWALSR